MININNNGTWNQIGDIVEGDKIINGISQDEFNSIKDCVNSEDVSKEDIKALIAILQEINASQNDFITEYAYMASVERNSQKSGILKKIKEGIPLTNGAMTLGKTVMEIVSNHPEAIGAITGYLGTLNK